MKCIKHSLSVKGSNNKDNPFSCVCLHGDRKPQERKASYESFKSGLVRFLICTDVAARGIDIGSLPFSKFLTCSFCTYYVVVEILNFFYYF